MPNRKRKLDTSNPPAQYEISIEDALDTIMSLYDAIAIAENGRRGDILMVGEVRVAIPGKFAGENPDVHVTVCPDSEMPHLKLVES
mgnify:FL=1